MKYRPTISTITRTFFMYIALINQALAIFGKDSLPIEEDTVYQLLSLLATIITSLIVWWKNNSFTKSALQADLYLKELKNADR
ncbi:MAG: phage holin [Clostridia bacterium]|nr:phage holin [Clostridia bacterium]